MSRSSPWASGRVTSGSFTTWPRSPRTSTATWCTTLLSLRPWLVVHCMKVWTECLLELIYCDGRVVTKALFVQQFIFSDLFYLTYYIPPLSHSTHFDGTVESHCVLVTESQSYRLFEASALPSSTFDLLQYFITKGFDPVKIQCLLKRKPIIIQRVSDNGNFTVSSVMYSQHP